MEQFSKDMVNLKIAATSTGALLDTVCASLDEDPSDQAEDSIIQDPLCILQTAATLIHAQSTKLGLLATNKPLTPSAIIKVIQEISTQAVPAMAAAVISLRPDVWTVVFVKESKSRTRRLLSELKSLIHEIVPPENGDITIGSQASRDALVSTGVVWECCDAVKVLRQIGPAGVNMKKALEWQETIQDAIAELKDWSEDGEADSDEDDASSSSSLLEVKKFPKNAPELRDQLQAALGKLRLIGSLLTALSKKRLKLISVPAEGHGTDAEFTTRVNKATQSLGHISDQVDEMAAEFYERNSEGAAERLRQCIAYGLNASQELRCDSTGKEDPFTAWIDKWKSLIELETKKDNDDS